MMDWSVSVEYGGGLEEVVGSYSYEDFRFSVLNVFQKETLKSFEP